MTSSKLENKGAGDGSGNTTPKRPDTLDRLLSHQATVSPEKIALLDPPDRNRLEGRSDNMAYRQYSFQTLNDTVSRLAARLTTIGLQRGDYIGLQLPNFVEAPLLVLASMRAGLIPCLLPLSWSNEDISCSFERLKPVAIASCGQVEMINASHNMRELAFSHLNIRFVMGAGYDIADGVTDLGPLIDPLNAPQADEFVAQDSGSRLNDIALVTYADAVTPVPHTNGQILSSGLLHVLEFGLSSDDHILSAFPLSSMPGLAAHLYPWLMSGCTLSLHHPFQFEVLHDQLQNAPISFFAAPQQVIDWMVRSKLPAPQKLAIVKRDNQMSSDNLQLPDDVQLFDLWNLAGLGSVPVKYDTRGGAQLFVDGRICLPAENEARLCLAAGQILEGRLHIKGRIFPGASTSCSGLEWFALKQRFDEEWLDTGLAAHAGPDNSIELCGDTPANRQKIAS